MFDDDEDMEDDSVLDVVGDLEEDMGDFFIFDFFVVNVEVVVGGKVMVCKEDGIRVFIFF